MVSPGGGPGHTGPGDTQSAPFCGDSSRLPLAEEKLILDTPLVDAVVPLPLVRVTGGLWVAEEGGVTPLQSVSLWMGDTPLLLMINIK